MIDGRAHPPAAAFLSCHGNHARSDEFFFPNEPWCVRRVSPYPPMIADTNPGVKEITGT
jgi:hypothetical protein